MTSESWAEPSLPSERKRVRSLGDGALYRRTFVGRERELAQLQAAFDAAAAGTSGLAMVAGEPGIGKTAVCEELAAYAQQQGGQALFGHCYEEGSLSLPYLAFIEALRTCALARDSEELRRELGADAAEVARSVPELRERLQLTLPAGGDPEEQRWRLLNAVSDFLQGISRGRPLLLVLEDLHWADRGTLDMLLHVARNLHGASGGARILIAGTYRDVEVDRAHPLSDALAGLRRAGSFLRLGLRGLDVDEVHRLYEATRGHDVPRTTAELVHRQTEGNPLFAQELMRYFVEEGIVVLQDGRYVRTDDRPAESLMPEGLRDVVGRRLNRLSDKTNQMLSVGAVIGREFGLETLQRVAGLEEDALFAALDEAVTRGAIEERSAVGAAVTYRFTHAFFREALYDEIIAPRRIRWHQQVARALEGVHNRRLEEHAAELAEHFSYASDAAELAKAVRYGELAAERATSVFAFSEAARLLERALAVQDVLDPGDRARRCSC